MYCRRVSVTRRYCVKRVIIPPPTRSVNEGILFFNRSFFLFFHSPSNVQGRSTDRQPSYLKRSNIGVISEIWSKIWGATPIKIWGFQKPQRYDAISVNFPLCLCTAPERSKISPIKQETQLLLGWPTVLSKLTVTLILTLILTLLLHVYM